MPQILSWTALGSLLLHASIVLGLAIRVLSKRKPTGVSMAWITLLVAFPIVGVCFYVLLGETWLCGKRTRRTAQSAERLVEPVRALDAKFGAEFDDHHPAAVAIAALGRAAAISPPLGGNGVELLGNAPESFQRLIQDIESAGRSCDLLYYIWQSAGRVAEVQRALIRAAERGVHCRVLVDAVGSRGFLRSTSCRQLRAAGVEVRASLPVNFLRGTLHRVDIRNHRKLAVIDDQIAHVGSLNMADPDYFMRNEGFGKWVDLNARVAGPSAALLGDLFEADWAMESSDPVRSQIDPETTQRAGDEVVQAVPSGPGQQPASLFQILTAAVYGATKELTITTPYFIPDEAFASGLIAAATRGVKVTLVVPSKVNGVFVRMASMAYYDDLLSAGVRVHLYNEGLLHAKTIAVDDEIAIIGTVNIDRRSFWLNYELSLVLHGQRSVEALRTIQGRYISQSSRLTDSAWMHRGRTRKLVEHAAQLLAPIL